MSDAEPPEIELDADALAMLRAYRAEERLPAEVHERVWSRVRADVEPAAARWVRYAAVTGLLAAAAVGVLWMGGQLLRAEPRAPASQAGYQERVANPEGEAVPRASGKAMPRGAAPGEEPRAGSSAAEAEGDATVEVSAGGEPSSASAGGEPPSVSAGGEPFSVSAGGEPSAASASERATPGAASDATASPRSGSPRRDAAETDDRPPAPPEAAPGSTLAEENRLLARARAALIDGRPEQALARLGEHAQRFPGGLLSEERQALRAVALCEAGRDADGDTAAKAFLREHPQAALAERVRSACLE